jgi:hypothetical protein
VLRGVEKALPLPVPQLTRDLETHGVTRTRVTPYSGLHLMTRQVLRVASALKGGPRGSHEGGKMDMEDMGNWDRAHRMGIGVLLPQRQALWNELEAEHF